MLLIEGVDRFHIHILFSSLPLVSCQHALLAEHYQKPESGGPVNVVSVSQLPGQNRAQWFWRTKAKWLFGPSCT